MRNVWIWAMHATESARKLASDKWQLFAEFIIIIIRKEGNYEVFISKW